MDHGTKAAELFLSGYNCAQSVFVAFCDVTGMEEELAKRLSSSFGGGLGRLREVCGAVSGMAMVLGILYGAGTIGDDEKKQAHYARVQELTKAFQEKTGSYICRELLDHPSSSPKPSARTAQYYAQRPCAGFVMEAAQLLDDYIEAHPYETAHL